MCIQSFYRIGDLPTVDASIQNINVMDWAIIHLMGKMLQNAKIVNTFKYKI